MSEESVSQCLAYLPRSGDGDFGACNAISGQVAQPEPHPCAWGLTGVAVLYDNRLCGGTCAIDEA